MLAEGRFLARPCRGGALEAARISAANQRPCGLSHCAGPCRMCVCVPALV